MERILSAGELEFETAARYRENGIPLNNATLADLAASAERLGLTLHELAAD